MRPNVLRGGWEWLFAYEQLGIGLTITNLRETYSGLQGEIFADLLTKDTQRLHWSHISISKPSDLRQVAASLRRRTKGLRHPETENLLTEDDWLDIVEQAAFTVGKEFREGKPIEVLDQDPKPVRPPRFLIRPLVERDETTILFAPGGVGKSYLALTLATLATVGGKLANGIEAVEQVNVLYLDFETVKSTHDERFWAVGAGMGIHPLPVIYYREMHRPLLEEISLIRMEVQRLKIGLVIIDSMSFAVRGDLKDDKDVRPFMTAVRSIPCSRLVLAHVNKTDARRTEGESSSYGSSFTDYGARSTWELVRADEGLTSHMPDGGLQTVYRLGLYNRKVNKGRKARPIGLKATFVEDANENTVSVRYTYHDLEQDQALLDRTNPAFQLRALLRPHPRGLTQQEIAEELDMTPEEVLRLIRRVPDVHEDRLEHPYRYRLLAEAWEQAS